MFYKHESIENQPPSIEKFIAIATYYKEIKSEAKSRISVTFKIDAFEQYASLKPKGFIRVNKKTFPLILSDLTGELQEKPEEVVIAESGSKKEMKIKTLRGTFLIPRNLEKEILEANFFAYRVFIDDLPVTFIVKHRDLKNIKSFIGATEHHVPR